MGVSGPDVKGEAILYGFLDMIQPENGPRVNMDTVLLAGFAGLKNGERAIELGCAHGAVSLILAKRFGGAFVEGLDVQPHLVELARENAGRNGLTENTAFRTGDLRDVRRLYRHQSFDAVVVNPPYEDPGFGRRSESEVNRVARQGELCTLDDVCAAAAFLLKNKGRLFMVMRALRLADTLAALRSHKIEPRFARLLPGPGSDDDDRGIRKIGIIAGIDVHRLCKRQAVADIQRFALCLHRVCVDQYHF